MILLLLLNFGLFAHVVHVISFINNYVLTLEGAECDVEILIPLFWDDGSL